MSLVTTPAWLHHTSTLAAPPTSTELVIVKKKPPPSFVVAMRRTRTAWRLGDQMNLSSLFMLICQIASLVVSNGLV
jgi:hypothetical protein